MKAVRVVLDLHWGFSIKQPYFSAAQPSYPVPPPPTLIGAVSYPYSLFYGFPELVVNGDQIYSSAVRLLDAVAWVALRLIDIDPRWLLETRDISRVLIASYVRSDHVYPQSSMLWAVQVHGKIFLPSYKVDTVYLVPEDRASELLRAAWGVARLGVKEALVSVRTATLHEVRPVQTHNVRTRYSFPRRLAAMVSGDHVDVMLPTASREWYSFSKVKAELPLEEYLLPVAEVEVELAPDAAAVEVNGLGTLILPRDRVKAG